MLTKHRSPIAARRLARPHGMTLIEVLVVTGANAVLMATAIGAFMAISRADRTFARRLDEAQVLAPLLERLRDDIHAAGSVQWDEAKRTLNVEPDGGNSPIVYRVAKGRCMRVSPPGAETEEEITEYRLPQRAQLTVTPAESATGDLVHITWSINPAKSQAERDPPPAMEIVVAVGRNERLLYQ
jgi:type II secretory pathway pseudopilin PulG